MTFKPIIFTLLMAAAFAACGNYSNEDLEFMNAVPARQDFIAYMPRDLAPANEAELAKDTHAVVTTFNGALDFLAIADLIRAYPPTSRIPDGRVWGPIANDSKHPGWQWRFVMMRDTTTADKFTYTLDEQPIGAGDTWYTILSGWFISTGGGVRRGMGYFTISLPDAARAAGFTFDRGGDGTELKLLQVTYSTADYPISVVMYLEVYTQPAIDYTTYSKFNYTYEALESGQGGMHFDGTDSTGKSLAVDSRWLPTGRGRADATYMDPSTGANVTWTECWNDSFVSVYDNKPWDPTMNSGDASLCPDIPAL